MLLSCHFSNLLNQLGKGTRIDYLQPSPLVKPLIITLSLSSFVWSQSLRKTQSSRYISTAIQTFLFLEICGMCWREEWRVPKQIKLCLPSVFSRGTDIRFHKWGDHTFSRRRLERTQESLRLLSSVLPVQPTMTCHNKSPSSMYLSEFTLRTNDNCLYSCHWYKSGIGKLFP